MRRLAPAALLLAAIGLAAAQSTGTGTGAAGEAASKPRRSGFEDMSTALQRLQRDDTQNPAWLWLKGGEARFAADCARCHDSRKLGDVAARYPAFDAALNQPVTLSARINLCRTRHMESPPLAPESDELLGLETFLGWLARDRPIAPPADPRLAPARATGQRIYQTRYGQLDFSCAQCHDDHAGRRLAGSTIPQAHPTGYPLYRMEWQGMGSLQRRLRSCMTAVRAEPFPYGSEELTALELYLAQRAAGLPIETPAVRP